MGPTTWMLNFVWQGYHISKYQLLWGPHTQNVKLYVWDPPQYSILIEVGLGQLNTVFVCGAHVKNVELCMCGTYVPKMLNYVFGAHLNIAYRSGWARITSKRFSDVGPTTRQVVNRSQPTSSTNDVQMYGPRHQFMVSKRGVHIINVVF